MVTQVAGTYTDLHSWENLYMAYRKAARGKRGRMAAATFEYHLEDNLIRLQDELDKVRLYLHLAHQWRWLNPGQYEHAGRMVTELGRLLGGWRKITGQLPAT